jgi:hypothetical protein
MTLDQSHQQKKLFGKLIKGSLKDKKSRLER